jgi:hypothetical protein
VLPLAFSQATDWKLVKVPVPENVQELSDIGFLLFHRAGDYWIGGLAEGTDLPKGGEILEAYKPGSRELYRVLLVSSGEMDKFEGKVTILFRGKNEVIFQAMPDQLLNLPEIKGEWIRITTVPKFLGYRGVRIPSTDDFHPFVQELVNQVDQVSYTDYLQTLEDFVTRNTHTSNCDSAADWILSQFQSMGLDAYYHDFTISGNIKHNVVGELPGVLYPDSVIFITSHYDATAGVPWTPEPVAPGADDNGSGTACVTECARILSQYNFEKTIRFITFAGEEQGLYGSSAYVDDLVGSNVNVVGSFNYDMIAYSGNDPLPPDLVIYADYNPLSQAMADKVAEAVITFVSNDVEPDIDINPSMGSSDHGPFWDAGLPAICGIEEQAWGPDFNPYYHSTNDLVVNCDLDYATNCTRAAIAALADYAVPIVSSGPYLSIFDTEFDEITGNGNGAPDPGETISILVTLTNVGDAAATNVSATLSTSDPYLVITQNSATYPDLDPQQTGVGSQAYILDISPVCPQGQWVTTELHITADGFTNAVPINFMVGDPIYDPTGPDAYGYLAYDPNDAPEYPVYDWVEICPDSGGLGTQVPFTLDDQTFQFDLPFTFRYYGQDFTRYTIAANGWVGMGDILQDDYSNSGIPNDDGPAGMIAPYWEDLSPQRTNSGGVWRYYDDLNHRLIVEYNHIEQYAPTGSFETFQVVLYDPAYYPTTTGDGRIRFQYKSTSGTVQSEGTVCIEDPSETMGLQYLYDGNYDVHAAPIEAETVILFTPPSSTPDMIVELTYQSGSPVPASGGNLYFDVYVENAGSVPVDYDAWLEIAYEGGSPTTVVQRHFDDYQPGWTINRPNTYFPVPGSYAAGDYTMTGKVGLHPDVAWDESGFPFTKEGLTGIADWTPFVPDGVPDPFGEILTNNSPQALPERFAVVGVYPNPFNPVAVISFKLPVASLVKLDVFDVNGRSVSSGRGAASGAQTTLTTEYFPPGMHEITFNGSRLASGIYIYRLTAGKYTTQGKMVLLK